MADEIRCKRIIEGKTYNTETSTLLGWWEPDDAPYEHALFKTRHGAYFLYTLGHANLDEFIEPKEAEAAKRWMEQHCSADRIEAEFGEMPEAGDSEARITLRIPETLRKRVAVIAQERNQSLNAWIQRCLERGAAEAEAVK